jgi:hypothetical protein
LERVFVRVVEKVAALLGFESRSTEARLTREGKGSLGEVLLVAFVVVVLGLVDDGR